MRGRDVEYATRLLVKAGHLDATSGTYGEEQAAGARRAKYLLGYPQKQVVGTFGNKLERYLRGLDPLPAAYEARRKKRLAAEVDVGAKALAEAERWVGTKEKPAGTNRVDPFTEWYGWHGWGAPWCAVFVTWCLDKAGFDEVALSGRGDRWAYCPYIVRDARAKAHGLREVSFADARPGDIVLFDWDDDGVADHVGFLKEKRSATTFESVEGNTSPDNFSNGGKVVHYDGQAAPLRSTSDVVLFVRAA